MKKFMKDERPEEIREESEDLVTESLFSAELNSGRLNKLYEELHKANPELAENVLNNDLSLLGVMVKRNTNNRYGESYACMGLQGILFQIIHKATRLKNSITVNNDFEMSESEIIMECCDEELNIINKGSAEHLIDLINYGKLALSYMETFIHEARLEKE